MNQSTPAFAEQLLCELRAYQSLCEQLLALVTRENQSLGSSTGYDPAEFSQQRKVLLPQFDKALITMRGWRNDWQASGLGQSIIGAEVKNVFQIVQGLIMKILLLDRDNQQAMLHRGLVPAKHLPTVAARQPHCVADAYRRHAAV